MAAPANLLKGFARTIDRTKPDPSKRITISDPDTRGLYVRITPKGVKTFTVVAVNPDGKQVWAAIGGVDEIKLDDAREKAKEAVRRIKAGLPAVQRDEAPRRPRTFESVRDDFLKRHVRRDGHGSVPLRSSREIHRIFCGPKFARWIEEGSKGLAPAVESPYIPKSWHSRPFEGIRRIDVTELLDEVQDKSGPRQADAVLAQLSSMFNWYASRSDDYVSPIVRGMKRTKPKERERKRILDDNEIRRLWEAAGEAGTFGAFVRTALLTGQRREKVARMKWSAIVGDVWIIETEEREKGNAQRLRLPPRAIEVINGQPRIEGNPHVFTGRGAKAMAAFSQQKKELDRTAQIAPWVIHDLRRTARSLMARARVDREVAERILGHAVPGVEGVYDRHRYFEEKGEALQRLAELIQLILEGKERGDLRT
jgi:integrase